MEKKLQTKEDIWYENIGNSQNAMTIWGDQEYQQGVEDGRKKLDKRTVIQFILIGVIYFLNIFIMIKYFNAENKSLYEHFERKYSNQLIINAVEKAKFDSVVLSKNKINNRKADAKKVLDGM